MSNADPRSANPFESAQRAIAINAGLPTIPQYELRTDDFVAHPDLANPLRGVILEADSWGFHASKEAHDRDCVRYNTFVAAGWLVLRFTWPQVMFAPRYVERTIQALMRSIGQVA